MVIQLRWRRRRAQSRSVDDRDDRSGRNIGAALIPKRARPRSQLGIPRTPSPEIGANIPTRFVPLASSQILTSCCRLSASSKSLSTGVAPLFGQYHIAGVNAVYGFGR